MLQVNTVFLSIYLLSLSDAMPMGGGLMSGTWATGPQYPGTEDYAKWNEGDTEYLGTGTVLFRTADGSHNALYKCSGKFGPVPNSPRSFNGKVVGEGTWRRTNADDYNYVPYVNGQVSGVDSMGNVVWTSSVSGTCTKIM